MSEKPDIKRDMSKLKGILVNFLVPLICVGIAFALFMLVIYPSINSIPTLTSDLDQKIALDNQLQTKLANLKKLVDFKKAVDENSALVSNVLVSETMVPELMTQIDLIAKESGIAVTTLSNSISTNAASTSGSGPKGTTDTVVVSMAATGTYDQLVAFFEALENSGRIVMVDNFRFSIDNSNASNITVSVSLSSPYLFVQSNAVTDDPIDLDISSREFTNLMAKLKTLRIYKPTLDQITNVLQNEVKQTAPSQPTPTPTP
jgi:Tfp pilus assembly protein PilO